MLLNQPYIHAVLYVFEVARPTENSWYTIVVQLIDVHSGHTRMSSCVTQANPLAHMIEIIYASNLGMFHRKHACATRQNGDLVLSSTLHSHTITIKASIKPLFQHIDI